MSVRTVARTNTFNNQIARSTSRNVAPSNSNDTFTPGQDSSRIPGFGQGNSVVNNNNLNLDVPFDILGTSRALLNPRVIPTILEKAAALDATGGIAPVTADGVETGVVASSSAAGLYEIGAATEGSFNYSSKVLENINTILGFLETNDVNSFQAAIRQGGGQISKNESAELFNQLLRNQALIKTALGQAVPRERLRNQRLQAANQRRQQNNQKTANLGEQPQINNAGGPRT
ncbi:MAG: hypothetical protein QNJ31_00290 [Candidatus Caenarcaniphilales bacterium]|nr:hypothetical protein [Candidatus Caenarcaniphilales bacterium]